MTFTRSESIIYKMLKRATVAIDRDLLDRAKKATGARTIQEAIEIGLRQLIRGKARADLRGRLGKVDLALTRGQLLARRHAR